MNRSQRARKIKAVLAEKGIRQADIARQLQVSRTSVNQVISGLHKSERVRRALIAAGVPESLLYDAIDTNGGEAQ